MRFSALWWGAGITGGGAIWYFLSQRNFHVALWTGFGCLVMVLLAITLSIRNGLVRGEQATPPVAPPFVKLVSEPAQAQLGRERLLIDGKLLAQRGRPHLPGFAAPPSFPTHPEAKAAGPDGKPCGPYTTGELSRLRVQIDSAAHIGKESNELEEVQAGLATLRSAYVHYVDEKTKWYNLLGRLREIPVDVLVKDSGLNRSQIYRVLKGECYPRIRVRVRFSKIACWWNSHAAS